VLAQTVVAVILASVAAIQYLDHLPQLVAVVAQHGTVVMQIVILVVQAAERVKEVLHLGPAILHQ
jgi:hypothetical protein